MHFRILLLALLAMLPLCGAQAGDQDTAALTELPEGGFAAQGTNFHVTFHFADLKRAPLPITTKPLGTWQPGLEWSNPQGVRARLEFCVAKQPLGLTDVHLAAARLLVTNPTAHPFTTTLTVTVAPEGAIYGLSFERHAFFIESRPVLVADTPSRGAILADSPFAVRPLSPQDEAHVESSKGECRGEMIYDLNLKPGETQTLGFISPMGLPDGRDPGLDFYRTLSVENLFKEAEKDSAKK